MKFFFDSSIIVDIDRKKLSTISLLKALIERNEEIAISTITVSEILTGSMLRKDFTKAAEKAKHILNQFSWEIFDGTCAEQAAKLFSYLRINSISHVEYPDVLIAASFLAGRSDFLLTNNKKDFLAFPQLQGKVFSPEEYPLGK